MGLSSVLSTAISGLQASETVIDVSGNNIANANTSGFKASSVQFATQFLQTLSSGSAPSASSGGTNPQQIGLGALVSQITPDFSQGTLQVTSNPSDLAIQGNGFFIVQAQNGQQLYTRNGSFTLNATNQLVTSNGSQVLGYGIDTNYNIQRTSLQALTIALGSAAVAKATQNVTLQGTLSPTGGSSTNAAILQTGPLGDASYSAPTAATASVSVVPNVSGSTPTVATAGTGGSGAMTSSSTYQYEVVYADGPLSQSPAATESLPSQTISVTLGSSNNQVALTNIPTDSTGHYGYARIYRTAANGSTFKLVGEVNLGSTTSYTDTKADGSLGATINTNSLTGNYSYYVTYATAAGGPGNGTESRPSSLIGPVNVVGGRIQLTNLPVDSSGQWSVRRIYRTSATDPNTFTFVTEIPNMTSGITYTDNASDASIASNAKVDLTGPRATSNTLLVNLLQATTSGSSHLFSAGTLNFSGEKGGFTLATKTLDITSHTTVLDLMTFLQQALGIQTGTGPDPNNPIPSDGASGLAAGGYVTSNGEIKLVGNNGVSNAISIGQSALQLTPTGGTATPVSLAFDTTQSANGSGAVANFVIYDSLGESINVRVTAVLQATSGTESTFRWYADSSNNDPTSGVGIAVGTGLVTFNGSGQLISSTNNDINIQLAHSPANKPLTVALDFGGVSGLSAATSSLSASNQDGFPPGKLTSYNIGTDGVIVGSFDNGTDRDLGQIILARFANPGGLVQAGQNTFQAGVNSGLAVLGQPGQNGIGSITSGAIELSNTDLSKSLISLISASEQYQGNTRVISTTQQLLTDLLNINH